MNKKILSLTLLGVLVLVVLAIAPQIFPGGDTPSSSEKVYRVGILSGLDLFLPTADGFKQKMAELGYREGVNIIYTLEKTNFEPEKEKAILKRYIDEKVDLIFTFPTEVSLAAKEATKGTNIPVVFADAFTEGVPLIDSVREPGGNITGTRFPGAEISIRRLEIMHELLPKAKRIWVTYQKDYPPVPPLMEKVRAAALTMGLTLVEVPALGPSDIHDDLLKREKSADIGIDAMLTVTEPLATQSVPFAEIIGFAAKHKLALIDSRIMKDDTGPLLSLFTDTADAGEKAATLADKIFKGIPAGSIPVESPEVFLYVNNKVAQKLGITLDEGFLSQAEEIVR